VYAELYETPLSRTLREDNVSPVSPALFTVFVSHNLRVLHQSCGVELLITAQIMFVAEQAASAKHRHNVRVCSHLWSTKLPFLR